MKYLNKFTTYLLENKPLLWHTRFIQLTVGAILLWILSYIVGYMSTDLEVLRTYSLSRHYTKSSYVFYHVGIIIVVFAIWAIYYYKNNAFKSFYPVNRFYFHKILGLLFIPFLLFVSATVSFEAGSSARTKKLLSLQELRKDANIVNISTPFLYMENASYNIVNKSFPDPFPLKHIYFNSDKEEWTQHYENLRVYDKPLSKQGKYPFKPYVLDDKNTTLIEGKKYQFYSSKTVDYGKCSSEQVVDSFYVFDSTAASGMRIENIKNYSELIIDDTLYINSKQLNESNRNSEKRIFAINYGKEITRIVEEGDFKELEKKLERLKKTLNRYEIPNNLNIEYLIGALMSRNFISNQILVDSYLRKNQADFFSTNSRVLSRPAKQIERIQDFDDEFNPNYQYIEKGQLKRIFKNYEYAMASSIWNEHWITSAFLALALAFLFIFFEVIKPIPFIISLPVWGVLFILYGILAATLSRHMNFNGALFGMFLLLILVQVLNLIILANKGISKKILNISYAMALACAPFILGILMVWIHQVATYEVYTECSDYGRTKHIFGGALESPIVLWLSGLIGILLILFLPRAWKSREE